MNKTADRAFLKAYLVRFNSDSMREVVVFSEVILPCRHMVATLVNRLCFITSQVMLHIHKIL